jgi:hypothetical protein
METAADAYAMHQEMNKKHQNWAKVQSDHTAAVQLHAVAVGEGRRK